MGYFRLSDMGHDHFLNSTGRQEHFLNSTGRHEHFLNSTGRHWAFLNSTCKISTPRQGPQFYVTPNITNDRKSYETGHGGKDPGAQPQTLKWYFYDSGHLVCQTETLYHRDNALLYIAYVMLIWAAPLPADRWHCSL